MRRIHFLFAASAVLLFTSCGAYGSSNDKPAVKEDVPVVYYYDSVGADESSLPPDIAKRDTVKTKRLTPVTPIDEYDEGLLDGEAAAEEDRLAGRPGMQISDDGDDEDYDDGYDDGYE